MSCTNVNSIIILINYFHHLWRSSDETIDYFIYLFIYVFYFSDLRLRQFK